MDILWVNCSKNAILGEFTLLIIIYGEGVMRAFQFTQTIYSVSENQGLTAAGNLQSKMDEHLVTHETVPDPIDHPIPLRVIKV